MFIAESTLNEIKNRLTISDVVSRYLPLVRKGHDNWVVCPFHSDKNPSMKLDDEKGFYYCFGCKASGNIFTFVMKMDNLDFVDAVKKLAEIAHVEIEEEQGVNQKSKGEKEALYALYEALNNEFKNMLWSKRTDGAKRALDYIRGRGYTDETINQFSVGYAPEDWDFVKRIASSFGVEYSLLMHSGLLSKKGNSYFVDRITFPIYNRNLKVVAFSARTMRTDDTQAKYINSSESPIFSKKLEFFGFNRAVNSLKNGDIPVLCEGNFDVMALHQAGITSALATCGTALSKEQCAVLRRYNDKVRTFFDSDDAGKKATLKAIQALKEQGLSPSVVVLKRDVAKDASEFLQNNGNEALQALVNSSVNGFQYAIKTLSNEVDITTTRGKTEVLRGVLPLIHSVSNAVERDDLFHKTCAILALDEDSARLEYDSELSKEMKNAEWQEKRAVLRETEAPKADGAHSIWTDCSDVPLYETTFMKQLAYSRDLFSSQSILKGIDYNSFKNPKARAIYAYLRDRLDLNVNEDDEAFLEGIEEAEMRKYIEDARMEGEKFKALSPKEKNDIIKRTVSRIIAESRYQKQKSFSNTLIMDVDNPGVSVNSMMSKKEELDELMQYGKRMSKKEVK